jgi:hypothetical protein
MAQVQRIALEAQVQALAKDLNAGRRRRPAVVVSVPSARTTPWINADRIAEELGALADVYVLDDLAMSWAFTAAMPDRANVYGGAGRVYPTDLSWVRDPFRSRLQLAYSEAEAEGATTLLIESALDAAAACGLVGQAPPAGRSRPVTGVVSGCPTTSQVVVQTSDGWLATIRVGTLLPGVDADRLFRPGMRVSGVLDTVDRILDIRASLPDPRTRVRHLQDGQDTWARVDQVGSSKVTLCPYPGVPIEVSAYEVIGDADGDLRDLLTEGETVAVRVRRRADRLTLELVNPDFSARESITALSFLPGGPPWLLAPNAAPPVAEDDPPALPSPEAIPVRKRIPTPADLFRPRPETAPAPLPAADQLAPQLDAARASIGRLNGDLNLVTGQLDSAKGQIGALEKDLAAERSSSKSLEKDLSRLRRKLRDARRTDGFLFLDPAEQFTFGVYNCWVHRIPAAEKADRPLTAYRFGPKFFASLDSLDGISREKIYEVVVDVLTGIAETMSGRDMHRLRQGMGGDDPIVRRKDDDAVCWRVSLQKNTPSARRLHFWRHADYIELSRVVLHDDCLP